MAILLAVISPGRHIMRLCLFKLGLGPSKRMAVAASVLPTRCQIIQQNQLAKNIITPLKIG